MKIHDWVIDVDTHITEPAGVWVDRLPRKYLDDAPRLERLDDGRDVWRFGTLEAIVPVGLTAMAGWPEPYPSAPQNMDQIPAAAYDAKARLAYMDQIGVWAMALYPNIGGFGNQAFLEMKDPELRLACVRAYNDWLTDWCEPAPERFIKVMAIPFWDVDATVAEIYRCAAAGFKGILFSGEPQALGQPMIGDHHWDPVYRAAAETGLPLNLHIGSGEMEIDSKMQRAMSHGIGATMAMTGVEMFLGNAVQVADLILSGALPRHPDVNWVSVESGIGWVPFVMEAADYGFEFGNMRLERPEFELLPSEYFRRQVYACAFFEEHAPRVDLEAIGADNVMFETDYPHPACLFGNVREKIDAAYGHLNAETARKVLFDNAARLYRVNPPATPWQVSAHREQKVAAV